MEYENLSDSSSNYVQIEDASEVMITNNSDLSILDKEMYDPTSKEFICCIEMINNNKVYIRYDLEWTIKDVNNEINKAHLRCSSK